MIYFIIIVTIFISDLLIKNYIEGTRELKIPSKILNDKLIIRKYHNSGAMLNMGEKNPKVVRACTVVIVFFLICMFAKLMIEKGSVLAKTGFSLIIGGSLSNLYDRFVRKYVIDYFSFNVKFEKLKEVVFNISDIFIFIGAFLLVIADIFKGSRQ